MVKLKSKAFFSDSLENLNITISNFLNEPIEVIALSHATHAYEYKTYDHADKKITEQITEFTAILIYKQH